MLQRCTNPKHKNYARYGGSGVVVFPRWRDFEAFLAAVGERPDGMTLDRYPNREGNYEPGNVRWATKAEQAQNTRMTKLSPEIIRSIRNDVAAGEKQISVARRLGLSRARVNEIVKRKAWASVA